MNGGLSMVEMKSGYKMTEVGVIPEDWEVKEFNETFSVIPNNSLSRDYLNTQAGEYHDIHYGDVLIKYGALLDAGNTEIPFINKAITDKWVNRRIVTEGDIIMADTAEDNTVGKCSEVINVNHKKIVSGLHTFWLHPNEGLFEKGFLGYFMNHSLYHNQLLPLIHGTKVSSVSKNEILGTRVLVPLKNEQTAIATALSDVDSLISALTKKIEKKKAIKQGLMQQLLTGKKRLPGYGKNREPVQTEWGAIPKDWKTLSIGKCCSIKARIGWQGLKKSEYLSSGEYVLVTGTDFLNGRIDWKSCVYVSKKRYEQDANIQIVKHDILITKDGTIGKVAFLDDVPCLGTLNSGIFVVRSHSEELDQCYLSKIFESFIFDAFLESLVAGSTINHLYQKDFVHFNFPVPPTMSEQTAIANILSDCDSEIAALEEKRDKYKEIKQGMMQQLLTGKIRLIK